MSRETKIGILVAVAIAIFVVGFKYLKGQNVLSDEYLFYAEYDNVDQLLPSNPIFKNGLEIGKVRDVYMKENDPTKVVVEMNVSGELAVPKNAQAVIISTGMMGGKAILLEYAANCTGANCAESGDYLQGRSKGLIGSLVGSPQDVQQYVNVVRDGMVGMVDSLSEKVDSTSEIGKTFADLQIAMNNLAQATGRFDRLLANSSGNLEEILTSVESLTENLAANNEKITGILRNVDEMTGSLNRADLGKTVNVANAALEETKKVMSTANDAMTRLSGIMEKAGSENSTLGMLLNDKGLYNNLGEMSNSITLLTSDIREHPERYRRILSKKTKTEPIREIPDEVKEEGN